MKIENPIELLSVKQVDEYVNKITFRQAVYALITYSGNEYYLETELRTMFTPDYYNKMRSIVNALTVNELDIMYCEK